METSNYKLLEIILDNYKTNKVPLSRTINQIENILGSGDSFNYKQLERIERLLKESQKEGFLAAGGSEEGFKIWLKEYNNKNKLFLNSEK